jgi:hypothetical protein
VNNAAVFANSAVVEFLVDCISVYHKVLDR